MQGMQEIFKIPGGSNTHWTLNSYDKVNPTNLIRYDVQLYCAKKRINPSIVSQIKLVI